MMIVESNFFVSWWQIHTENEKEKIKKKKLTNIQNMSIEILFENKEKKN